MGEAISLTRKLSSSAPRGPFGARLKLPLFDVYCKTNHLTDSRSDHPTSHAQAFAKNSTV